jgi:predicted pyridoxine 5'-phosphate oxidase superfamily flavin-nucleotide-binding protein
MSKLPEEVIRLLKDYESNKALATVDDQGNPHVVFKGSVTVLDDGSIAYAEVLESSQTNANLIYSLWFDKKVAVIVRGKDGISYQIKGKPVRYDYTSPLFKEFYLKARERKGPDSEVAGVWIIAPESVRNETPAVRKAEEEKKHPFFRHLDRESVSCKR